MTGGQRLVARLDPYPVHEYSIAHPVKTGEDFETLRAFFYVVGGDADAFRFKDWSDYRATKSNSALTLVAGSDYQLCRKYGVGSRSFLRPIKKPTGSPVIWRTRAGVESVASATVDNTTGIATISGHVADDTYTWVGEFHVPVAFKDRAAMWRFIGTPRMLTEWPSIELEEDRLA